MGNYVMIVQSCPKEGREDEYNDWYETIHIPDLLAIPGIVSARRYEATPIAMGTPGLPYLSIFEIEANSPEQILGELGKAGADGRMRPSDSYDTADTPLWIYRQRGPAR